MKPSRTIAVFLSVVLAVVAVPSAGACAMGKAALDHSAVPFATPADNCHEPASENGPPAGEGCPDCFAHCPLQAQAALVTGTSPALAPLVLPTLPATGSLETIEISNRPFRPPTTVPLAV